MAPRRCPQPTRSRDEARGRRRDRRTYRSIARQKSIWVRNERSFRLAMRLAVERSGRILLNPPWDVCQRWSCTDTKIRSLELRDAPIESATVRVEVVRTPVSVPSHEVDSQRNASAICACCSTILDLLYLAVEVGFCFASRTASSPLWYSTRFRRSRPRGARRSLRRRLRGRSRPR
jgi:hypothetical protein